MQNLIKLIKFCILFIVRKNQVQVEQDDDPQVLQPQLEDPLDAAVSGIAVTSSSSTIENCKSASSSSISDVFFSISEFVIIFTPYINDFILSI